MRKIENYPGSPLAICQSVAGVWVGCGQGALFLYSFEGELLKSRNTGNGITALISMGEELVWAAHKSTLLQLCVFGDEK